MELVANFNLNNDPLNASFDVSKGTCFDALFKIDSQISVVGEGLIDTTYTGGVVTITSLTYIHEQGIAADQWHITHNLKKYPSVTLVDTAGTQFIGKVQYIDENSCIVYMNGATKGKAYLN